MNDCVKRSGYLLLLAISLASCGGGSSSDTTAVTELPPQAVASKNLPADDEILAKVYNSDYSVPDGFLVDDRAGTAQSYTVHHVKDESVSYEVCTNDFETAQTWEAQDNLDRKVNGYYVGSLENDRYFEFVRELSYTDSVGNIDELTSPGFARVFKCSYVVRDGVDRSLLTGFAGKLTVRPLDNRTLKNLVEYLWQFTFFNVRDKKVLESYGDVAANELTHTMLLGLVTNRGDEQCDLVELVQWSFVAALNSGNIESRFETVHSLFAREIDGIPTVCAD